MDRKKKLRIYQIILLISGTLIILFTFVKKNIPFREFKVKKINEEILGELFSFFIIETIIIGKLLNISNKNV